MNHEKNRRVTLVACVLLQLVAVVLAASACAPGPEPANSPSSASAAALDPEARAACEELFSRTLPDADTQVVVVYDATASNADAPFPPALAEDLRSASRADGALSLIAVDGGGAAPRLLAKEVALSTEGPRDRPSVAELAEVVPACVSAIYGARTAPRTAGTDLHRALALAAELLSAGDTLWVVSDWFSTTGPLSITTDLQREAPDLAGRRVAGTARLRLAGIHLETSGLANASVPLLSPQRQWMRSFVRSLCTSWQAGGCAGIGLDPVDPVRSAAGLPEDDVAPFPGSTPVTTVAGCRFELPSTLLFGGDSARLSRGARAVLGPVVDLLLSETSTSVEVIGHTASSAAHTAGELVRLSRRRAQAVSDHLVRAGVDRARVHARGVGDTEPTVEDIDPHTGRQVEAMAARERRVDIEIGGASCSR